MCSKNGATLPKDMADIADAEGVRVVVMKDFLRYTTSGPLAGFLAWLFAKYPAVRDRALADPWFLYKLAVEVLGDVGLAVAGEDRSTRIAAAIRAAAIARARGTHLVDADVLLVVLAVPLRPAVEIPPPAVDRRLVVAATPRAVVAAVAVARLRVGRGRGILRRRPRRRAVLRGRGGRGDRPSRSRRSRAS